MGLGRGGEQGLAMMESGDGVGSGDGVRGWNKAR